MRAPGLHAVVSISRLSAMTGVTPRALRHYEEMGLIRLHRAAHGCWTRGFKWLGRAISQLSPWLTRIEIHPRAKLGEGIAGWVAQRAAFRRAGLLRVSDLDELFAATETLGHVKYLSGKRLAILSNGGGLGSFGAHSVESRGEEKKGG